MFLAIGDCYCTDEVPFGKEEDYVAGQKPYDGGETFETSGCTSDRDSKNIMSCVKRIKIPG